MECSWKCFWKALLKDLSENGLTHLKIWVQEEHRQRSIPLVYPNEPHTVEKKLIISLSYFYDRLLAVVIASFVLATLCVRTMSAPFKTQTASAINEPASISDALHVFKIFPMNDLLDTDTRSGRLNLIALKFFKINKSL